MSVKRATCHRRLTGHLHTGDTLLTVGNEQPHWRANERVDPPARRAARCDAAQVQRASDECCASPSPSRLGISS